MLAPFVIPNKLLNDILIKVYLMLLDIRPEIFALFKLVKTY